MARQSCFNAIHLETHFKVDIFPRKAGGTDGELLARARPVVVGERPEETVRIATPEDVVVQKLAWYRRGDEVSDLQWRDVLGVLKDQGGGLDRAYLARASTALGVADLLARALEQAGLTP